MNGTGNVSSDLRSSHGLDIPCFCCRTTTCSGKSHHQQHLLLWANVNVIKSCYVKFELHQDKRLLPIRRRLMVSEINNDNEVKNDDGGNGNGPMLD